MKNTFVLKLLFAICLFCASCGNRNNNAPEVQAKKENEQKLPDSTLYSDASFAVATAGLNMKELKWAKLCETNASLDTIVKFGRIVVNDYDAIDRQLRQWANSNNISLPANLGEAEKSEFDQLKLKKGRDFEKQFIRTTIDDHDKILNAYRKETEIGKDTLLKAWAREKITILEPHLQTAQWIKTELEKPVSKNKE